jgi:hypothetical protein
VARYGRYRSAVHLGGYAVGTLPGPAFAVDLRAAAELFDEDARIRATLTPATPDRGTAAQDRYITARDRTGRFR